MSQPFLTAQWRKLAIANYKIDPSLLQELIPAKTELDLWNGHCYISLVGFMFLDTKVKGCRIPFHVDFEEVNLRFYVKHFDGKEWKRGVVFIKEIVPRRMITFVANKFYGEHYETMKMKHHHGFSIQDGEYHISYSWKKNKSNSFYLIADENKLPVSPGTEEEFITEHYWGYTKIDTNRTSEYEVSHPRWEVYPVKDNKIDVDFSVVYGEKFRFLDSLVPHSVFLAEGSEIKVMEGKNII